MPRGGFPECTGVCGCRCHKIAAGRKQSKNARRVQKNAWSHQEVKLLKEYVAGGSTAETIVRVLDRTLSATRSRAAVIAKAKSLGLLMHQGWYSGQEVLKAFGVNSTRLTRWRESGLIAARRHVHLPRESATGRTWWHYEEADILAFIDAHAGLAFNPQIMKPGPWKNRATVQGIANLRKKAG